MLPAVLLGGLLIIRKVRRFDAAIAFLAGALLTIFLLTVGKGNTILTLQRSVIYSPLIFFAAIMLTEPLTMPPDSASRIMYGFLVGWMFAPETHLGAFYFTPELALLAGNLYSYIVSPKGRFAFKLAARQKAGQNVYDFIFETKNRPAFKPGQYMEWTLPLKRGDSRGNRRYLTLASSPTEKNLLLGVKFYPDPSRFKQELVNMRAGDEIFGGQLSGDFVLPKNPGQKLVFVAGGIGITPFRSMLKYLIDQKEKRPIITLYSNRNFEEIAYADVLEEAREKLDINTFYTLTDLKQIPKNWQGLTGHFNPQTVAQAVPDFMERVFYISGSHNMVSGFKQLLLNLGVHRAKIKTDFFPGLV
jgi:ferredoxin-NADP reductase